MFPMPLFSHPTKAALVTTMVRLLDERDLEDITTELVLHESGISRSSLYHHFGDLGELTEVNSCATSHVAWTRIA